MRKIVSPLNAYLCLPEAMLSGCFILISRSYCPSCFNGSVSLGFLKFHTCIRYFKSIFASVMKLFQQYIYICEKIVKLVAAHKNCLKVLTNMFRYAGDNEL